MMVLPLRAAIIAVLILVVVHFMFIDCDTTVRAAANSLAHGCGIAACSDDRDGRHLRNEDWLRSEFAATECELADCGIASMKKLVVPLTTPSTAQNL